MKINANSVRPGNVIEYKNKLWSVVKIAHTQPGKGGAYIQMELKDIKEGTKLNERFRSSEDLEKAFLDSVEYQYLYTDGDFITVMDLSSYEQKSIPSDLVGDPIVFLQDEMIINVTLHEGSPIAVELPEEVTLEVIETEAVIKGQTATSSFKPAILENQVRVMVPQFIDAGTKVIVKTADRSYVGKI